MTESVVGGSTDGTCACAKAALDASVGIDFVFAVTLGNCADGAVCCTCAACDASFSDTISHGYYLRKIFDSEAAQLPQQYFTTKTAEIKPFRINKLKAALYDIQCGRKVWFISKNYLLSIASLMDLPGLKATERVASISIASPVMGLRPLRAGRSRTSKQPKPTI